MSRILNLLASVDPVPTPSDPEFQDYTLAEKRLINKSGQSKLKLLKFYRRVKGRPMVMSGAHHAATIN